MSRKESFEQVERWFTELKSYAENIKLILIGNKSDLPKSKMMVTDEEARSVAMNYGAKYLPSSAIDDRNISEIFSTLALEIYHSKMDKETRNRKKSLKLVDRKHNRRGCC